MESEVAMYARGGCLHARACMHACMQKQRRVQLECVYLRRFVAPAVQARPLEFHPCKPRVLLDVVGGLFQGAQPHGRVRSEELGNQVGHRRVHLGRAPQEFGRLQDALEDFLVVVVGKRGAPHQELENEAPQRPVVGRLVVPLREHQFRAQVLRSTAEGETTIVVKWHTQREGGGGSRVKRGFI